jgi:hypothetical protein
MVDWLTIAASVGGSLLASIILVEYRLRRERSVEESAELDQWYNESASYAAEVRRVWQRLFDSADRSSGNLSEISSEMSLLERQISRHASNGEQLGADEEVVASLDDLAEECRQVTEHSIHLNSAAEFEEFRVDILDEVEELEATLDDR